MASGEYVAELSTSDRPGWRPVPDLDPVPDNNDLATERAAHDLRMAVAKLNREDDTTRQYRTRYVPPPSCKHRCSRGSCCGGCGCPGCGHSSTCDHVAG